MKRFFCLTLALCILAACACAEPGSVFSVAEFERCAKPFFDEKVKFAFSEEEYNVYMASACAIVVPEKDEVIPYIKVSALKNYLFVAYSLAAVRYFMQDDDLFSYNASLFMDAYLSLLSSGKQRSRITPQGYTISVWEKDGVYFFGIER